ncbi:MAG TPA: four helix bundle protein [Pyrinomonadaceae bacterium]|jgi:four helix bundle protein|nr:four helix bundle protein [Pyrinomonadaceae bacterium]
MQIKSFRDLRVWQAGIDLVRNVYQMTAQFPRSEVYGLASQMQRAAVSVPSNIAEGHTRESTKEYLQHLSIAQASLAELETQLEIAKQLSYVPENEATQLLEAITSLSRQLFALRNALMNPGAKAASPGS